MLKDRTANIENEILHERKPRIKDLFQMWFFVFRSTKAISLIYMGLYLLLSLLRPFLAFLWGSYITTVQNLTLAKSVLPSVGLIVAYFLIDFFADMIQRYVVPREEIERLDLIQSNHQQERFHAKLYEKIASISPEYLEAAKINDNIEQVFNFVGNKYQGVSQKLMMQSYIVLAKIVSVLSIAASLYIISPWLCLMVIIAPVPSIWSLTAGEKLRFRFRKDNTALQRRIRYFQDLMISPAAKEMKTLGLYDFFYDKWKTSADQYTINEQKLIRSQTLLEMLNSTLVNLANVSGVVMAIVLMSQGRISLGALGAVMSLVSTLVQDTGSLFRATTAFLSRKNEAAQFHDFISLPDQRKDGAEVAQPALIEAVNLKYRYPLTERYVLDGLNLTVKKGEKIALVGENGMGKTTFVKILTGSLSPSEGELRIDGTPIEQLNANGWIDEISSVVQDPGKYVTFTVGDNVFLGDTQSERSEESIDKALAFSGFTGADKTELLGKDVGGTELSGGQWQKLAIARAAYRGRNLILLDEPTSNLDPLAETEVFEKYIQLAQEKTVLFVTHRISIAALADRIVVFSNGNVVQDGTHEQLILEDGEYQRLYTEQAKWYNR